MIKSFVLFFVIPLLVIWLILGLLVGFMNALIGILCSAGVLFFVVIYFYFASVYKKYDEAKKGEDEP